MSGPKFRPPKTPKQYLEKLPQFEPDYSFYHRIDFDDGRREIFPHERKERITHELVSFIGPHARYVEWAGKLTGVDRFVENAMHAIATFEYRRRRSAEFDRESVKEKLRATVDQILKTCGALREIDANRELSHFLESIFVAGRGINCHQTKPARKRPSANAGRAARRRAGTWLEIYREFAPNTLASLLMMLEPVLTLAAERVEFQSGDFQRDEIAQEFCDDVSFAWISATGKIPTFSKQNPMSRNKSPFAKLLALMNNSILNPEFRHETEFLTYGFKARNRMREKFPELCS